MLCSVRWHLMISIHTHTHSVPEVCHRVRKTTGKAEATRSSCFSSLGQALTIAFIKQRQWECWENKSMTRDSYHYIQASKCETETAKQPLPLSIGQHVWSSDNRIRNTWNYQKWRGNWYRIQRPLIVCVQQSLPLEIPLTLRTSEVYNTTNELND